MNYHIHANAISCCFPYQRRGTSRTQFKTLLTMKLAIFLLCCFSFSSLAKVKAQKVNLDVKNESLRSVVKAIQKQTGYSFIIHERFLRIAQPVTVQVAQTEVLDVLPLIFESQPFTYEVNEETVTAIMQKTNNKTESSPKQTTVRGRVTDSVGNPIEGVIVQLEGTSLQTATDKNGYYVLDEVLVGAILVFRHIAYQSVEVLANRPEINVVLRPSVSILDETIVIGYGTTSRRLATGSVAKVTAKEIGSQPISNPLQALQGRAAGVLITNTNGIPGSNVSVQIRGRGSLTAGTEPLYIVDGVPFNNTPLNDYSNPPGAAGQISPFNSIVPSDIESIEILKDADATAIYGSRGANGVVLVTTKKGKAGKTTFDVNINTGIGKVTRLPKMLNTQEYLQFRREAYTNDDVTPTEADAFDILLWDTDVSTDWMKKYTGGTAHIWEATASVSGGNNQNQYLLRGNYRKDGSVYPGDWIYDRTGVLLNTQHSTADGRFSASTSVNFTSDKNNQPWVDFTQVYLLPPNYPLYNEDGSLYWLPGIDARNPESFYLATADHRHRNLIANTSLLYTPVNGIQLKLNGGYHDMRQDRVYTMPSAAQMPHQDQGSYAIFGDNNQRTYLVEPQMTYQIGWESHNLNALLGSTWQYTLRENTEIWGNDYTTDVLLGSLGAAGRTSRYSNSFTENKFASVFGRINYSYRETYLLNASFRTDGSSRFAPDRRWGTFYAIGAAWIFSNEKLFRQSLPFFSYGKLRGSFGSTGNDQITDYQYLATYGSGGNFQGMNTLNPTRVANSLYSWEVTQKIETAIEIGLFKDRFLISMNWYRNRSDNQLINYTLPFYTGFSGYQSNWPALVQNTGLEAEVQLSIIKSTGFRWEIGGNITLPRNKLLDFPDIDKSSYNRQFVIGEPLDLVWGYNFVGVDSETGNGILEDVNGDNSITNAGDWQIIAQNMTRNFGGVTSAMTFKGLELNLHIQYINQLGRGIGGAEQSFGRLPFNVSQASFNSRWQFPGDKANVPRTAYRLATGTWAQQYTQLYRSSNAVIQDASYIRLKNVNLSYRLPDAVTQAVKVRQCRLYFSGQNLLTYSALKDIDPETQAGTSSIPLAPLRMLTFGLQTTF